jgi:hypothetical protein
VREIYLDRFLKSLLKWISLKQNEVGSTKFTAYLQYRIILYMFLIVVHLLYITLDIARRLLCIKAIRNAPSPLSSCKWRKESAH